MGLSHAQQIAAVVTPEFGILHTLGPGTFIGSSVQTKSSTRLSGLTAKTDVGRQQFTSTEVTHFDGSYPRNGSSSSTGSSSLGNYGGATSVLGQLNDHAGGGGSLTAGLKAGDTSGFGDPTSAAPLIANPIPATLVLFASGLAGLCLLGWRTKRIG